MARVHVDSWRATYAGLVPEDVLAPGAALYPGLLGTAWADLPAAVRAIHPDGAPRRVVGSSQKPFAARSAGNPLL